MNGLYFHTLSIKGKGQGIIKELGNRYKSARDVHSNGGVGGMNKGGGGSQSKY